MTSATPTSVATVVKSRPRTSTSWPRAGCGSRSFTTRPGAGRRGRHCSRATTLKQVRRDTVPGVPSGGQGKRPKWAKLLPEMLRPLGYRSYHSGKWHVDGMPLANGFDRSYYVEDLGRYFNPRVLFENDQKLPPVKPGTGYYTTTAIADHGIKYLREHAEKQGDQPFFLYLAFNAPHFPLQARPDDIARYRDRYRDGWEVVRAERWKRIQELGLVSGRLSDVEREVGPPYHFPEALEDARSRRGQPSRSVGHAHRPSARVSSGQDGDSRRDGRPDGSRDRPGRWSSSARWGPSRTH